MQHLSNEVTNPQNFAEIIEVTNIAIVSDKLLENIKEIMIKKYQTAGKPPGQIVEIKLCSKKVKIIGFSSYKARTLVKEILDKASLM